MAFTVVPLHNLNLAPGTRIPFGTDFVVQDIPEWLTSDIGILSTIQYHDPQDISEAKKALVAEYEAEGIGSPDPTWKGKKPKSIQYRKFQAAMLANMSMWLRQPSPVSFTACFHALSWKQPNQPDKIPISQQVHSHPRLYCHPNDRNNPVTPKHIIEAASIYATIQTVPTDNPVWEAMRFFWEALTTYRNDFRYTSFWIGLEALFGPEDSGETTYKICQRIAFFLADTPDVARDLFRKAKNCYGVRSKIVHGRWKHDPKINDVMVDTEAIVRTALRNVLANPDMLNVFISKKRDRFLEDWVFSRSTDPPPFPN